MVGRGDDVDRLRAKAAALGLGRSVHFPGFLPDAALRAVMRHAAVFAMPSRGEGFGLVYLQAMRAGIPCLGSRDDAAGDVISGRGDGPARAASGSRGDRRGHCATAHRRADATAHGRRRPAPVREHVQYPRFRARLGGILARAFPAANEGPLIVCGIAAAIGVRDADRVVSRMSGALAHRGPRR